MSRLSDELTHHLTALEEIFRRDGVTDVHLQPGGYVWSGRRRETPTVSLETRRLIARYLATLFDCPVTPEEPTFSAGALELFGSRWRVSVLTPPVAREEAVSFRRISSVPRPLEDFGTEPDERRRLLGAMRDKRGILVIGRQGSGKTTFASALLLALLAEEPHLRVVLIEDTPEISIPAESSHLALVTSRSRSHEDLISESLRTAADLILIGEVRDGGAVSHLVTAAVTGHGALTTFHAASATTAYERMRLLMQMRGNLVSDPSLIRAAFPVVVRLEHRRLVEIHDEAAL